MIVIPLLYVTSQVAPQSALTRHNLEHESVEKRDLRRSHGKRYLQTEGGREGGWKEGERGKEGGVGERERGREGEGGERGEIEGEREAGTKLKCAPRLFSLEQFFENHCFDHIKPRELN